MESFEERSVEFEDESLESPASIARKKHSFHAAPHISAGGSDHCYAEEIIRNSVIDSIKIVVFSAKINLLMPFGPLAILVDKLSGNHVSCLYTFYAFVLIFCIIR
jgi:Ca2+:H+ antiporter